MKKKTLMDKAIEKRNEEIKKEELYISLDLDKEKNNIIFEKKSNLLIKFLSLLIDIITRIVSFSFYIVILILLTIGATVIINPQTRNIVTEIFYKIIGIM